MTVGGVVGLTGANIWLKQSKPKSVPTYPIIHPSLNLMYQPTNALGDKVERAKFGVRERYAEQKKTQCRGGPHRGMTVLSRVWKNDWLVVEINRAFIHRSPSTTRRYNRSVL